MKYNKNYIIILIILIISIIYSYPNIYGENPAILIKVANNVAKEKINEKIKELTIPIKKITTKKSEIILRFKTTNDQFNAFDNLKKYSDDYTIITQNIIKSEKIEWLDKIKAYPMKLGLDLRGGIHIITKINTQQIINKKIKDEYHSIKNIINKSNIKYDYIKIKKKNIIKIKFFTDQDKNIFLNSIKNISDDFNKINKEKILLLKLIKKNKIEINDIAINKTLSVLTKRINELGVSETIIKKYGHNKISIELPGIQDIDHAKNIIGKTATLNFMLLKTDKTKKYKTKVLYDKNNNKIALRNKSILTGNSIIYASSGFESTLNKPCVNLKIDKVSAEIFNKKTSKNIGKPMAIIYKETYMKNKKKETNEYIISIANIMSPLGEQFQITGLNINDANDLAILLRSGSLPANITIIEEKIIGPSLGEDNITNSTKSLIISLLIIMFFMLMRYKKLGLISNIALITNITLLIAVMSIINVTLTLSGITGIILTIGMSIDSNILIFERIKEEIKKTSNINAIIHHGFNNALSSIIDANVTTFLMAFILFILGDGPIKGFAITLSIGIITSIYSSLFVTKNIINFLIERNIKII